MPMSFQSFLRAGVLLALVTWADDARADLYRLDGAGMIGEQTCAGIEKPPPNPRKPDLVTAEGLWREVDSSRYAFFVSSYAGETSGPGDALNKLRTLNPLPGADNRVLRTVLDHVQMQVASGNLAPLGAFDPNGVRLDAASVDSRLESPWTVDSAIILRCLLPKPSASIAPEGTTVAMGKPLRKLDDALRLRGDVDALAASGDDRKSAAAATFSFDRVRAYLDDGSRKETRTYSIDAVLGAVLHDDLLASLTIYAGYELGRERSRPAPTLTVPATQSDGDTEVLKFGLVGSKLFAVGPASNHYKQSFDVTVDTSYLFDLTKDSERIRGRISSGFYSGEPWLVFCKIGGYTDFGNGLWTRCELDLIGTFDVLTRHGSIAPSVKDHFAHAGGRAGAKLFFGNPLDNSAFATAEFLYLRRIDGDAATFPHVKRHKFSLGYRWWNQEKFAIEAKGELFDGINPDSFEDENSLSLGFGIIF